jgi:hypothetical protein
MLLSRSVGIFLGNRDFFCVIRGKVILKGWEHCIQASASKRRSRAGVLLRYTYKRPNLKITSVHASEVLSPGVNSKPRQAPVSPSSTECPTIWCATLRGSPM